MSTKTAPEKGMNLEQILALVEEGKKGINNEISEARAEVYLKHKQLEQMGGEENYAPGLETVVNSAGKIGVTAADLHLAFPDSEKLNAARDKLIEDGKITVAKAGMTLRFTVATDYTKIDEVKLCASLLADARAIAGANTIVDVKVMTQTPKSTHVRLAPRGN